MKESVVRDLFLIQQGVRKLEVLVTQHYEPLVLDHAKKTAEVLDSLRRIEAHLGIEGAAINSEKD